MSPRAQGSTILHITAARGQGIFDDTSVDCLGTGMQCHGCCVLQRCIAHS
ncbi:hypothetical protein PVAP13_1KG185777 [Panicum virgatum]|uniref:Uncharacterized protein n=1 Tax=Panicum virgatum TaxID=38727 RepID=A0A8T0XIT8_PANVG|nr:hypothetical protein PVAP13_1KG185777 [Panicum virgatum]